MTTVAMRKLTRPADLATDEVPVGHLADLPDAELLVIVRTAAKNSRPRARACELLVSRYAALVAACVQPYRNTPEPTADLMQVGYVGLLKAINNYDPEFGSGLAAYAQPCITGEIKRHFRDRRWHVHVERHVQELALQVRSAGRELAQELGRIPTDDDLANRLETTPAAIRRAKMADTALQPWSLDAPLTTEPEAATFADTLGEDDHNVELWLNLRAVAAHWHELPSREQRILRMRFYGDMTQAQIGSQLGLSQMHVSRLLAHALSYLRHRILELPEPMPHQAPRRATRGRPRPGAGQAPGREAA
jgi:RNA polymerase sigma-B factor